MNTFLKVNSHFLFKQSQFYNPIFLDVYPTESIAKLKYHHLNNNTIHSVVFSSI